MRLTVAAFLEEANSRAREANKSAYVFVVGLGLGVWGVHKSQAALQLKVYEAVLMSTSFPHISDVYFR